MNYGWEILHNLLKNGAAISGHERQFINTALVEAGKDLSEQAGNCHENMLLARKLGLIDEIWVGLGYEASRWHCHVWGRQGLKLCDANINFNEYFGVRVD